MTRRYALRDDQWERIKDFLPGQPGYVGANSKDNRLFVEAVLFRIGPESHGETFLNVSEIFASSTLASPVGAKPESGNVSSRRWRKTPTTEYAMIDSTIVRAHQHSAGAKKSSLDEEAIGRTVEVSAPKFMRRLMRWETLQAFY